MSEKLVTVAGETTEVGSEELRAVEIVALRNGEAELRIDGRTHYVPFVVQGTQVFFSFEGDIWSAEVTEKGARGRAKHRDHSTAAPMPGVALKILVGVGDVVAKGAPLLILEAMKMEHQIVAPFDGKVKAIHAKQGEMVQPGLDLVELEENPS